ncbi:MAG: phosphatase PAP2 family protein [Eubacteriales bacterium]|nr:phosphatase PAP2 family protein [Eubacteriales bacterium]MDD3880770.1 phosphatase PAP2 family protein [Eubacteriales bacterium]MDD3882883.1 phosphatase PAP2 family protein [Eubacteriales bacterium]MDD4511597.1 phosphatase PAP2 family protein [Eubacteriales bacterium]
MDINYLLWLQDIRTSIGSVFEKAFVLISELGMETIPIVLVLALYWCIDKRKGQFLMFSFNLGAFFNGIIKLSCCVYRPWVRDARVLPAEGALGGATGYSFPSGHSTTAAATYGGLGYAYRKNRAILWCMVVVTLLVMLSRNILGVHTPQDVLVGAALGVVMILLAKYILRFAGEEGSSNRDLWLAIGGTALCALSILYISLKAYPIDTVDGVLLVDPIKMQYDFFSASGALLGLLWGWVWERRAVRFEVSGSAAVRIVRFIIGIAITLFLYKIARGWLITLLGGGYGRLVGAFFAILYAVAVHPMAFSAIEKRLAKGAKKA